LRTYQLRRYELKPELFSQFVAWATIEIFPLREKFGFTVEWSYVDQANSQLIWLASAEGDRSEFETLDAAWQSSKERAEVVPLMPPALIEMHLSFVEKA
jgi:hypothetical protein